MTSAASPSSHSSAQALPCPETCLPEARRHLAAAAVELLAEWRVRFRPFAPRLSARALFTLEQLLLPRPAEGASGGEEAWWEQVRYSAPRLAKLGLSLSLVNEALAQFHPLAVERLRTRFGLRTATAIQDWFQRQAALVVAEAYVAGQSRAVQSLLAVLDAELGAADLNQLLQRLLQQAAQLFPLRWGEVLLLENSSAGPHLRHAAAYGLEPGMIYADAGVGPFFQRVLRRGAPAFLLDAANDPRVAQPYYRALEVKSVWAVPLLLAGPRPEALGILTVAFDRVYECLPQEKELLLALAQRSSLAIERTRMAERLGRERARATELSRRLLQAHDEERRRISRDLHDETGQALLALRLYLEMGLRQPSHGATRKWMKKGVALVDQSVAELRRILAQLSPLVLDELGLEAALRLELRRLRAQHQWRARFQFTGDAARLDHSLAILVYRVVLEGLRNAARHARARSVQLKIAVGPGQLSIRLRDDGVGLPEGPVPAGPPAAGHWGLIGMRERVRLAGGQLELDSSPGQGLSLDIHIPLPRLAAAPAS
ncbi:MAG TPA: histidine kinase [Terriglobales bacterium]|nr:histidine kinase [Terriglobales bacterium]